MIRCCNPHSNYRKFHFNTNDPPQFSIMTSDFYFSKGLNFWEWHHLMTTVFKFDVKPNGAPLGEEITRNEDFKEASCTIMLQLPQLDLRLNIEFTFDSMRDDDRQPELNLKWNPAQDTRIHRVSVQFPEADLVPGKDIVWSVVMPIAPHMYQFYKKLFLVLSCDEAIGFGNNGESIWFHWVRAAQCQTVMSPYESGNTMTEKDAYDFRWRELMETRFVFPELSYGQRPKVASE